MTNTVNSALLDPATGWSILALFSLVWIFLGWFWGRKARALDDFMLAGRNVGMALGVATAMATWVTSNTTMAAPQLAGRPFYLQEVDRNDGWRDLGRK